MSKDTITLKAVTINLKTKEVYASPVALKRANLQPNPKDKGIDNSFTDKNGKLVEYKMYSVIDAKPIPTKTTKTTKAKASDEFKTLKELMSSDTFINSTSKVQEALVDAFKATL